MTQKSSHSRSKGKIDNQMALALQGGGALGSTRPASTHWPNAIISRTGSHCADQYWQLRELTDEILASRSPRRNHCRRHNVALASMAAWPRRKGHWQIVNKNLARFKLVWDRPGSYLRHQLQ